MSEEPIREFDQQIHSKGDDNGASLYLPVDTDERYDLSGTDAEIEVVIEDGSPVIRVTDLDTGFSEEELLAHADSRGWTHEVSDEDIIPDGQLDGWGHTFSAGDVRVSVDSPYHIDGMRFNVTIEGPHRQITDVEQYRDCRVAAHGLGDRFHLQVIDGEGLVQRLYASVEHDTEEPVESKVVETLLGDDIPVAVKIDAAFSSLEITLAELDDAIESVRDATANLPETE